MRRWAWCARMHARMLFTCTHACTFCLPFCLHTRGGVQAHVQVAAPPAPQRPVAPPAPANRAPGAADCPARRCARSQTSACPPPSTPTAPTFPTSTTGGLPGRSVNWPVGRLVGRSVSCPSAASCARGAGWGAARVGADCHARLRCMRAALCGTPYGAALRHPSHCTPATAPCPAPPRPPCRTPYYAAPEVVSTGRVTMTSDV
jgi:hypothetical protein